MPDQKHFNDVLRRAMDDFETNGYDSAERLEYWDRELRAAAQASLIPESQMEHMLREAMAQVYRREVENAGVLRRHPGVRRWVLDKIKPHLRDELSRRILSSAQLIKLNRQQEIDASMRRFAGWATSIPAGGTNQGHQEEAQKIRKTLSGLSFRERRVLVDQGHKLLSNISNAVAVGGGAIAGIWHSHWRQGNYNYREDHKDRDYEVYLLRDSWAQQQGLVKPAGHQYTDQITQPGEEVFCRCWYQWIYTLRALDRAATECITQKGRDEMERARAAVLAL